VVVAAREDEVGRLVRKSHSVHIILEKREEKVDAQKGRKRVQTFSSLLQGQRRA